MAEERVFETYLDSVTFDGKTKWFTEPPFNMLREIAEASDEIFKMVFKKFNLKTTDAEDANLISLIRDYAADHSIKAFDRLPSRLQSRIRILHEKMNKNSKQSTEIEVLAHMMLEQMINDFAMDIVFAKIEQEQTTMAKEQYEKSDAIFDEIFSKKDELEEETPGVKANIEAVKDAFNAASNCKHQMEYMMHDIPHTVKRYHQHYNSDTNEFNKRCSESKFSLMGVKDYLLPLIKSNLPYDGHYTTDEVKAFIVLTIRSIIDMDFNDLKSAAYIHRLFDRIYHVKFESGDRPIPTFDDIAEVIDRYRKIVSETSNTKKKKK